MSSRPVLCTSEDTEGDDTAEVVCTADLSGCRKDEERSDMPGLVRAWGLESELLAEEAPLSEAAWRDLLWRVRGVSATIPMDTGATVSECLSVRLLELLGRDLELPGTGSPIWETVRGDLGERGVRFSTTNSASGWEKAPKMSRAAASSRAEASSAWAGESAPVTELSRSMDWLSRKSASSNGDDIE